MGASDAGGAIWVSPRSPFLLIDMVAALLLSEESQRENQSEPIASVRTQRRVARSHWTAANS